MHHTTLIDMSTLRIQQRGGARSAVHLTTRTGQTLAIAHARTGEDLRDTTYRAMDKALDTARLVAIAPDGSQRTTSLSLYNPVTGEAITRLDGTDHTHALGAIAVHPDGTPATLSPNGFTIHDTTTPAVSHTAREIATLIATQV